MSISNDHAEELLQRWLPIAEKLAEFTVFLNVTRLEESEYLLLKVIMYTMKAQPDMTHILDVHKMYKKYLYTYCRVHSPSQPNRASDLIAKVTEVSYFETSTKINPIWTKLIFSAFFGT